MRVVSGAWHVLTAAAVVVAGCTSTASRAPTATSAPSRPLMILVTNDDGVGAPGIDAVVTALRSRPSTEVTVVAPAANQSGTGVRTTSGKVTVTRTTTASGYAAWAVHGFPADSIVWAIDDRGVSSRPDLVVSGINSGQNIGPLAGISGTVGAARAALSRGIPALAASQGIDDNAPPDFGQGVTQVVAWVVSHRQVLVEHGYGGSLPSGNLNIPTCPHGAVKGPVTAPAATTLNGITITTVDCSTTSRSFGNDAQAFVLGYAVIAPL